MSLKKYIGIAAGQKLAGEIKDFAKASLENQVRLLWQDTNYLVFEVLEGTDVEVRFLNFLSLCPLKTPYLVMGEREFKNSPAELLDYLDAVRWMEVKGKSEKKSRVSEKENMGNGYRALLLGQVRGVRDYLLKGNKGVEATICAMTSFNDKFSALSEEIEKDVQAFGGEAVFAGGSAEILLTVSSKNHCLFRIMELVKCSYEKENSFAFGGEVPSVHLMAYLFPSEMDVRQARANAERLFSSENDPDGDSVNLYIERRLGKGMAICIPKNGLAALDDRIVLTCRSIGNGAAYMQLLANSLYDEMLLEYCRFLNHECEERMDPEEEAGKKG